MQVWNFNFWMLWCLKIFLSNKNTLFEKVFIYHLTILRWHQHLCCKMTQILLSIIIIIIVAIILDNLYALQGQLNDRQFSQCDSHSFHNATFGMSTRGQIYRISSNKGRALNTSHGSHLIVLIEAGPWIQAGVVVYILIESNRSALPAHH